MLLHEPIRALLLASCRIIVFLVSEKMNSVEATEIH
jgi:hypothetical protein